MITARREYRENFGADCSEEVHLSRSSFRSYDSYRDNEDSDSKSEFIGQQVVVVAEPEEEDNGPTSSSSSWNQAWSDPWEERDDEEVSNLLGQLLKQYRENMTIKSRIVEDSVMDSIDADLGRSSDQLKIYDLMDISIADRDKIRIMQYIKFEAGVVMREKKKQIRTTYLVNWSTMTYVVVGGLKDNAVS